LAQDICISRVPMEIISLTEAVVERTNVFAIASTCGVLNCGCMWPEKENSLIQPMCQPWGRIRHLALAGERYRCLHGLTGMRKLQQCSAAFCRPGHHIILEEGPDNEKKGKKPMNCQCLRSMIGPRTASEKRAGIS
jgi:hypothetical protein